MLKFMYFKFFFFFTLIIKIYSTLVIMKYHHLIKIKLNHFKMSLDPTKIIVLYELIYSFFFIYSF